MEALQERLDDLARLPLRDMLRVSGLAGSNKVLGLAKLLSLYGAFSWGDGYFNLWLQYLRRYTVPQINNIPTAGQGAALINSIISGIISDWLENRPIVIVANMVLCLAGNAFVAVWEAPDALKFVGYIFITAGLPAQSISIAWINEVCQGNGTLRGLIVSIGNTFVYAINAWALVLLFPAVDGTYPQDKHPRDRWNEAYANCMSNSTALPVWVPNLRWVHRSCYLDRVCNHIYDSKRFVSFYSTCLALR